MDGIKATSDVFIAEEMRQRVKDTPSKYEGAYHLM
jgi:hypothetical protein